MASIFIILHHHKRRFEMIANNELIQLLNFALQAFSVPCEIVEQLLWAFIGESSRVFSVRTNSHFVARKACNIPLPLGEFTMHIIKGKMCSLYFILSHYYYTSTHLTRMIYKMQIVSISPYLSILSSSFRRIIANITCLRLTDNMHACHGEHQSLPARK